jgi:hypothetical protein
MKALNYISVLALLVLGSCTSSLYTGVEYDDLYFLPSDQPVARVNSPAKKQITESNLQAKDYYDNIYAADTLVSDEYSKAVENNDAVYDQNNYYDYNYDNYSYTGRLRRFYGNYFNPYWRDPFYYSWGFPSMSFGYGSPYMYDPFYYDYGYYGGNYGGYYDGYYGGYYGNYFGYNPYYSYYSPFNNYYNWGNNYSGVSFMGDKGVQYGRRESQDPYSTRLSRLERPSALANRDSYLSKGTDASRKSVAGNSSNSYDNRRTTTAASSRQPYNAAGTKTDMGTVKSAATPATRSDVRSSTAVRPDYNSANRTYTPSYSNPRLSTRPAYNNTRTNSNVNSGRTNSTETYRSAPSRSSSSVSSGQYRSAPSNQGSYSVPSRRSMESGSGFSSGSTSPSRSSSYDSGSSSRSSYSSGSSSSGSYSSGSSSSSSSSGSSSRDSGGSSSGGRR